ncbi:MAG: hypothetical protein KatS3mg002_1617 [Candidatus Woesearchaeota archaeon]|nr:MAG: hypothetical protein KatS3mg002_1617 [Candidatus Woesearchaeota archaeon]
MSNIRSKKSKKIKNDINLSRGSLSKALSDVPLIKRLRGRPLDSKVRQNMIEILYVYKRLYGYELAKIYNEIYPRVSQRLIYYHLRKGLSLGEFSIERVEEKEGNYSWGTVSQRIIYSLGANANPLVDKAVINHKNSNNK